MKILFGEPALLLEKPVKSIVVSDLHLGFEYELWEKGIKIPNNSWRIIQKVAKLAENVKAERIIIVGDVKHKITGASWKDQRELKKMFRYLKDRVQEILILPGNHDGGLKELLGDEAVFLPVRGYYVKEEKIGFFHGHVWPSEELLNANTIIAGHMHPVIYLKEDNNIVRQRVWLIIKTSRHKLLKKARGQVTLVIMPSFNEILSGKDITVVNQDNSRSPLLRTSIFKIEEAEVITLDGVNLGLLNRLKQED